MIYIILALGAFLRLINLGSLPISLFGDEIDVGYHAWSLWTTGHDYMGHLLPTYIQSLAEWRAPLLMYLSAPFVGLLGPTAFSTRLGSSLMGIASIYLIHLLVKTLFPTKTKLNLSLLSALILAITPWHIHYSRAAFEVTTLITLLILGTYFFLTYLKKPNKLNQFFVVPFALTFYTYSTANLFTPILAIALLLIYKPKIQDLITKNTKGIAIGLLVFLPIFYQIFFGPASGRFSLISIFNDQELTYDIVEQRTQPWVEASSITEKLFHNKPQKYLTVFTDQYLSSFSPEFLFTTGDPYLRHSVDRFGQLLWVTIPFLLLGLSVVVADFKNKGNKLLLVWLFAAPIPSALTQNGSYHATRLFLMIPPLVIITAIGVEKAYGLISKSLRRPFLVLLTLLTLVNLLAYCHQYRFHYKNTSSEYWHYGYQRMSQIPDNPPARVFINNTHEPSLLRFAFYTKYPPKQFHKDFKGDVPQENLLPSFTGFQFGDNYYFGKPNTLDDLFNMMRKGDIYFAAQGEEIPGDWDWVNDPPAGYQSLGGSTNVFGNPLFAIIEKE